ncbi:OmpA family protein [Glaciecola sp. MH2013]|uniref:OmpA family protein n=1 Tax=Glaciecola sp. MH2013 TaxID=2785524 RepID=UPI00189D5DBD|nr:OmpA family protein [Glaciecola sp. MH2013]MBF7074104.1 OmpA family protein [Glaciecola sp. MH2013]
MQDKSKAEAHSEQQLDKLRDIVIGQKLDQHKAEIQAESREQLAKVFTEALHDREVKDGSVNRVIQPIVTKAVEKSIKSQRSDFIDYLYPLVGSLVRKSVSVFFTDFIEKTNDIIENSFTLQGMKWRISAWRAGVSFSEYIASQTFLFKVEQVLLIHKETGALLQSLAANKGDDKNADLVSSMLIAINDFVADSFKLENAKHDDGDEQSLDQIKTDDFTLFIRKGPHVVLVAAVKGNMSRQGLEQLQLSLEQIQSIYLADLQAFNGDVSAFESATGLLQDCLLAEEKTDQEKSKTPVYGWLVLSGIMLLLAWYFYGWWQTTQIVNKIEQLNPPAGLVIQEVETHGRYDIEVKVFRDPISMSSEDWLAQNDIDLTLLSISEISLISLNNKAIKLKVERLMQAYPTLSFDPEMALVRGEIEISEFQAFLNKLNTIPGIEQLSVSTASVDLIREEIDLSNSKEVNEQLFIQLVGEISSVQVIFESGEASLPAEQSTNLDKVAELYSTISLLAEQLQRSTNLVIVGASDSTGEKSYNLQLSRQRSLAVRNALIERGLQAEHIFAVGVGEIDLPGDIKSTRKVLFNVMFAELND